MAKMANKQGLTEDEAEELKPHEGTLNLKYHGITREQYNITPKFFYRQTQLLVALRNIKYHLEIDKYDYPLIICGDTGTGKSSLLLHLIELWYRLILGETWSPDRIKHLKNTRSEWVKNFQTLKALDINANDEGADGITSKESMTKFGKDLQKLYMVFRKKFFFTIILIPDFFDLPLYFRKRIRGVIYVDKRGHYKFYTMRGVKWINALNETKDFKSIDRARPHFEGYFPEYKGLLRKPYEDMALGSADKILQELITNLDDNEGNAVDDNFQDVKEMISNGMTIREICKQLTISPKVVVKINRRIKNLEKYALVEKEKEPQNI